MATHVAGVLEHHRRQQGFRCIAQPTGDRPAKQAGAEHDDQATERDHLHLGQVDGFAGQRGEDQRGHEDTHVDLVGREHVRAMLAAIQVANRNDREHGEDDAHDLHEHGATLAAGEWGGWATQPCVGVPLRA